MRPSRITFFALAAGILALPGTRQSAAQTGRISPHESLGATIDDATLTVTYGRPSMRGRVIMGALVPYNRIWCPGADEVTTLTSSKPVRLGGLLLPAGQHALWMLPTADQWTLIINSDVHAFHFYHNSRTDLGHVPLDKRIVTEPVEQLTFTIEKALSGSGGRIAMRWENTEVSTSFTVE